MKKVCALLVFVGLLMASPLAYAQAIKVGVFDVGRVFAESKRWAKERDAFAKRGKALEEALQKKAAELKAFRESLEKKAGMLSEQARKEKEREYQQKARELERTSEDAKTEMQQMDKESSTKFNKSLMAVLRKLGQDEKYTLILEIAVVPYASKEIDITDQVLKAFDAAKE
jgi:outer membrane protein